MFSDDEGESEGNKPIMESNGETNGKNKAGGKNESADINNTLLYDIMGLKYEATQEYIKIGYLKLTFLKQSDKNPYDQDAVDNF